MGSSAGQIDFEGTEDSIIVTFSVDLNCQIDSLEVTRYNHFNLLRG